MRFKPRKHLTTSARLRVFTNSAIVLGVVGVLLMAFEASLLAKSGPGDVGAQWAWLGLWLGLMLVGIGALIAAFNLWRRAKH